MVERRRRRRSLWVERYLGLTFAIFVGTLLSIGAFVYLQQRTMTDREVAFRQTARLEEERLHRSLVKHGDRIRLLAKAVETEPKTMIPVGEFLLARSDFTSILLMEENASGLSVAQAMPVSGDGGLPVEIPGQVAGVAASLRGLAPGQAFLLPMSTSRLLIADAVESEPRRYVLGIVDMDRLLGDLLDREQADDAATYLYLKGNAGQPPKIVAAHEPASVLNFAASTATGTRNEMADIRQYAAFVYESGFTLEGHDFTTLMVPTPAFLGRAYGVYPWVVLGMGIGLTLLAGALTFNRIGRTLEIQTIVARRTRELRANAVALEEARTKAEEASSAKSEFLANMSHEIRTPLNAITGLVQILSRSEPLSPPQRSFIQHLQGSSQALFDLISDILDLSKIESRDFALEYAPFALADMLREMEQMLSLRASEKGLALIVDVSGVEGIHYLGDKARLRQIVINLVNNAIKFTEAGSVIVRVYARAADDRLVIDVSDTGIGIPRDKQGLVFEKFSQADTSITRRFGGTGLGLHISRELVAMMQGEITLSSEPGTGSTFSVVLPLRLAQPQRAGEHASPATPSAARPLIEPRHGRVLIVEDIESNIIVATLMLKELGYGADVASSGQTALERFEAGRYDAVLMDVQMPGMDGFETTRRLRRAESTLGAEPVPIIGLTAHAIAEYRDRCFEAGMNDFMTKPYTLEDLRRRLGSVAQAA